VSIGPVRVRTEDPVADEPDGQRHTDEADDERATKDDQLAARSGPGRKRAAGAGQQIQQGRTP
jgi:hypothetical protein